MSKPDKQKSRSRPGVRPVTSTYLRNAALHYVSQRSASAAMVRKLLERRAQRRLGATSLDDEVRQRIDDAIAELQALGLIDDVRYAEGRAASRAAKGLGRSRIAQDLQAKGIARATIAYTLDGEIDDLAQARRFAARKRLGAYRPGGAAPDRHHKDLAALARAGFGFSVASRALEGQDEE